MNIDAKGFNKIAKDILAPVYPVIAENIFKETGINRGICLDLGAGPGNLGLELAKLASRLEIILYDQSEGMLKIAETNCSDMLLADRVKTKQGYVEELPFDDNTIDLIVSRGSVFFWDDQLKAINEAYRVLKPGGRAYIGGGFGNEDLLAEITRKMLEQNPEWENDRNNRVGQQGYEHFKKLMKKTEVHEYEISRKQAGLWIIFNK
ncbi:MAG TPA: SAM-dependent methyltransferase [Desulfotomaculum sp.]|nr:MAG: Methyltransferase [Desulfotomaculum sp. 46_296]HAG12011.1 SAM-dependent methyltransferase [Desulfotomaculum sp.]HBY05233.1 SAM-dependent methyltransferase [Desulfotomaculum sp.]